MKKEVLSLGNRVLCEGKEIRLIELRKDIAIDENGNEHPYEKLDGVLVTPDTLAKEGFDSRSITTFNGVQTSDFAKLIEIKEDVFFIIKLRKNPENNWKLEISDAKHNIVCQGTINFWHTLENLITTHVYD